LKLALGADHQGYLLKEKIKEYLEEKTITYTDFGTFTLDECDYPEYAYKVARAVSINGFDRGILVGSTGIGMCIAANKMKGVRAVFSDRVEVAQSSRIEIDTNILCLGQNSIDIETARDIIDTWLYTSFEGGEHARRLELFNKLIGT
jgi:ribose 5-phosphate isomerase B